MNFKQKPGIYKVSDDSLIKSFDDAVRDHDIILNKRLDKKTDNYLRHVRHLSNNEECYLILDDTITLIGPDAIENDYLVGISGKNVTEILTRGLSCENLKDFYFPDLELLVNMPLKFIENHINEDGLCIYNNCLLGVMQDKEEIIIPENVKVITVDAFANLGDIKRIVFPFKVENISFELKCLTDVEIVLPLTFKTLEIIGFDAMYHFIYKGSLERLNKILCNEENKIYHHNIKVEPYTEKELSDKINKNNIQIEEIEEILDKKLTLDEILGLGKSIKEANKYFKQKEVDHEL